MCIFVDYEPIYYSDISLGVRIKNNVWVEHRTIIRSVKSRNIPMRQHPSGHMTFIQRRLNVDATS